LEELGKDDAVGPTGPDQLSPETSKRKSWQAAPDLSIPASEISIVPSQVEAAALQHDRREKRNEAEQSAAGHDRATPAYSAFEIPWQDRLLECLLKMKPAAFERLCQRILKESGFIKVDVTGRSGDGGIDGRGTLQVNPLVSFKVLFQCKRYAKSVAPSQVRDFRGAMQGRADKGIILTTGTFTAEARREGLRDGVPPIELVDGEKLLDMFEQLELGLKPILAYEVDRGFFDEFRSR